MTTTQIANWALDLMSETEIQALTENNKAARALSRQIQLSIDSVLEDVKPEVAKTTKGLSNDSSTPVHPHWDYQSELPGDFITAVDLWDGDPDGVSQRPIPEEYWDREGSLLLHNLLYPTLEYIKRMTDVSRFGPKLCEAVAYHLAASTARKITGSDEVAASLMKAYLTDKLPTAQQKEGVVKRSRRNRTIFDRIKRSPLNQSRFSPRLTQ